ncbi:pseudouridine synthase [Cytophagaceae bacterium ABcell3]|nr:pseudouridine synthase [Cytophagaceae bacterium ABcell3]
MELPIIYKDEALVAINKPHGLLTHFSPIARDANECALQLLRDQIGQRVWPVHRIDRKTGGVLLFTLQSDLVYPVQQQFFDHTTIKKHLAIVRGFAPESGEIDYPLRNENGIVQTAITNYTRLATTELPIPLGNHNSVRYSLVEVYPKTGRMHQIRRHFAHISHPIIGDRPHGCNKQNRFFKNTWQLNTMLLHAAELTINHPVCNKKITLAAPVQSEFSRIADLLKLKLPDFKQVAHEKPE